MKPNKFLKDRPCIYGLRNLINNKIYVGKTLCPYRRCGQYLYDFKTKRLGHLNPYLLNAMIKVGISNFEMFILEFCEPETLQLHELKWMITLNTIDRNIGYNLRLDSSNGMLVLPETSKKISDNLKKQWAEGVRAGHSEKLKKAWLNATEDRRKKQSEWFKKYKTKYVYEVTHPNGVIEIGDYELLKTLKIKSALGNMSRSKLNETKCNGYKVARRVIGE